MSLLLIETSCALQETAGLINNHMIFQSRDNITWEKQGLQLDR